nr:leucine-rich repeat protein [Ruminococcus bromii]
MKKLMNIISLLLIISIFLSIVPYVPFTVSSLEILKSGNYEYRILDNGTVAITRYNGTSEEVIIPQYIDDKMVACIDDLAFDHCLNLTYITFPESVIEIGDNAFRECSNLTSIKVNSNNTEFCSIDGILFDKNIKTLITFPANKKVTSYAIPSSVTTIHDHAFEQCINLTSITIPHSVTKIGAYAFYYCLKLSSVSMTKSITSISGYTFSGCKNLTNISIPNSVTSIGEYSFWNCINLTNIKIPDKVTIIKYGAFCNCDNLTNVSMPKSITSIGVYTFSGCKNLTNISIPQNVKSIGDSTFWGCVSLESVTIPNSVTSIEDYAFCNCEKLKSITIPYSVKSIGKYALGWYLGSYMSEFTIYGLRGSAAEKYAKENNINFASASNLKGIEIEPLNDIEAKRMLSFLFNAESKNVNTEYSEFYEFLTGQYNSQPYKSNYVGYSLLLSSYISTGTNANNYNNLQRKSSDATLYWLQRMVGNEDISSAVANELLGEAKNTIKRSLVHCVASDYDLNCIDSCMSTVTTIINSKDKVNEYVNKLFSTVSGVCFFVNYSKSGMYNYFEQYLNLRPSFDSADQYFNMLMWGYYSEYRYLPSYWKYSQDELNNWAELLYSIEQELISNSYYEPETTSPIIEPTKQPTTPLVTESTERPTIPSVTEPAKKPTIPSVTEPTEKPTIPSVTEPTEKPTIPSVTEPTEKPTVPPVTETTKKSTTTPTVEYIYTDNDTGITVTIENEAELIIKNLTDSESVEKANIALGDSDKLIYLYDISLVKNGVPIQSNSTATVKIPTSYKNAKIYEIKDNGTKTDMNALYKDGYLIFSSNQLSSYALAISKSNFLIGDINQDGNVDIKDATLIQKYLAKIVDFNDEQLATADTNGDGSVSIADATQIQRYLAQLIPSLG